MKIVKSLSYLAGSALIFLLSNCTKLNDTTPAATNPVNSNLIHIIDNYDLDETTLTNAGWSKTFEDNFDGDLSQWNIVTGGGGQGELEFYTADNLQVSNGALQITAKKQQTTIGDATPYNFTSGAITSNASISANAGTPKVMIVARIKVASGNGLTSILESYGNFWPSQGEIDNMQVVGNAPKQYITNYFYGPVINQNTSVNSIMFNNVDGDLSGAYHVYQTEWTQNALTTYIDGTLVSVKTGDAVNGLFGKVENLSLSMVVGGLFYNNIDPNTVQDGTMSVDYVKVFTSK